jgi:hypothetical protein
VTFDPFGDFGTAGYLRNFSREKDPEIVPQLEHVSFLTGIDEAFKRLRTVRRLAYAHLAVLIAETSGLSSDADGNPAANQVLGRFSEPELQVRYLHQQERRQHTTGGNSSVSSVKARRRKTR